MIKELLAGGLILIGALACAGADSADSKSNAAHADRLYEAASQAVYLEDQIELQDTAQTLDETPEGEGWDGAELSGRPYDGLIAARQWVDADGYLAISTSCGSTSWIRYQVQTDDGSVVWADVQYRYRPFPGASPMLNVPEGHIIGAYATNPTPLIAEEGPLGRLLIANCAWSNIPWPMHERVDGR